jgi:RNA polymerase sigma factor (sigma-70 family)
MTIRQADASNPLSPREREVMQLVDQGMTDQEIAKTLGISIWTVRDYLRNANEKLGASNRREASFKARQLETMQDR